MAVALTLAEMSVLASLLLYTCLEVKFLAVTSASPLAECIKSKAAISLGLDTKQNG